jgi:putative heme iron utilization protein
LSGENRDLQNTVKETEQMLTDFNIEKLPSFQIAMEKGMEKGMEIERAAAATRYHASRVNSAKKAIGQLDDQQIAELFELTPQEVADLH